MCYLMTLYFQLFYHTALFTIRNIRFIYILVKKGSYFIRSEKYESSVLLGNGSSCLFIFWKVLTWPFHLKVNRIYADFLLTDSYSVASCSVTSLKFIWISIETSFITILMLSTCEWYSNFAWWYFYLRTLRQYGHNMWVNEYLIHKSL